MADTATDPLTFTITISPNIPAHALAVEFRKIRDAVNRAYRNALIEDKMPVYHPIMQAMSAAAINCEGVAQSLDPPRVQVPGASAIIPGSGRA